jgi:DNA-binding transcriptional LysR family regulator
MLERHASSVHDSAWSGIDFVSITQGLIVAECLSFRRAATVLGVRQSTVSRRVRALEDKLGVSLFERHSGGVRLTAAGNRFLDRARFALVQLEHAVDSAGAAGRGESGTLRVGIVSSMAAGFLRELVHSYVERHPDVGLQISEGGLREHVALISKGRVDVAFVMGTPAIPNCDIAQFWTERLFVALPAGHPLCEREQVEWQDLHEERFIVRQSDAGLAIHDHVIKRLADLGHHPSVQRLDVGRETLVHLVALGLGIGFTSEAAIAMSFPGVIFRPIAGDAEILPFSAVWSPSNDNPAFRRFLSLARVMAKKQKQRFVSCAVRVASGLMNGDSISLCLSFLVVHVQTLDLWT